MRFAHSTLATAAASIAVLAGSVICGLSASVTFEAESGVLGSDWAVSNSSSPAYISITSTNSSTPGSANRAATYSVTFPANGTYQLYARVLVGSGAFNADSLFYGNGFGGKNPTNSSDWILVNGLAGVGFTADTDVVTGGGNAGTLAWKWINLSQFTGQVGFAVSAGNLTQILQIGGREAGLNIDKFAFGTLGYTFTVSNLDNGTDGTPPAPLPAPTFPLAVTNSIGASVVVGSNGIYSVNFVSPAWTFTGYFAQGVTHRAICPGADNIGAYSEIDFLYTNAIGHAAGIRLYNDLPTVVFSDTTLAAGTNDLAFPHWSVYPSVQNHLSFGNTFSPYNFSTLFDDNLWLFFQTNHDTFIISAATNFMVAGTVMNGDGSISCGINSGISQLPSGFTHRVILTAQNGINQSYSTWGNALLALGGKTPPANDAAVELNTLGYWTDNGAAYYYTGGAGGNIGPTLLSIKNEFAGKGVPLGYMQLDSWWYEKGTCQCWSDSSSGIYLYTPDPALFVNGLAAFQQQLGLPLITHSRWIATNSPYQSAYKMSASVCIDPAFWSNIMTYLNSSGVVTYEQDWLSYLGIPLMNLNDGPAYLNNMQAAAAANGINLQYCMVQGRDYLQGSLYSNLMTTRTCPDIFDTNNWTMFLYGSRIAQAMGIWPWSDVFRSGATRNLLISTLSAGPVGPGDALGTVNAANLLKSVRPDGVIVKPDVPLVPVDDTYVNDAQNLNHPFIAATYTDFANSRALYVFAYGESPTNLSASFTPASLGISGNAYVYDYFAATGTVVNAGSAFSFTTTMPNGTNGGSYFIAAPIGPSGVALIGDIGKFVTLGKKRFSQLTDTGTLIATVEFAAGERFVTLLGYSPAYPSIAISRGSGGMVSYNPTTGLFAANLAPDATATAVVQFGSGGSAPSAPSAPTRLRAASISSSQINLSWSDSAGAAGYNVKRSTVHGGSYTNVAGGFMTSCSDTGLAAGTTYYYVVSAVNAGGESANSMEAGAATVPVYTMEPVADAYVNDGGSANSNFRTATNLAVKNDGGTNTGFNRIAYLKFDVHALTNAQSARLILTPNKVDGTATLAYELVTNDSWTETGITWNNRPAGSGVIVTNLTGYTVGTPVVVDVTSVAVSQTTNDGYLSIRVTEPSANAIYIGFFSKEHPTNSWHPVLQYVKPENTPPTLAAIANRTLGVGMTLSITNSATDGDAPAQTLTFDLLAGPTNAVLNPDNGVLTWRPLVSQANTTNLFTVMVADNGTPSLSATQSFVVTVNPLVRPVISATTLPAGQMVLQVTGASGPDYQIQASTNLVDWSAVFTAEAAPVPFAWTNSNTGLPMTFFRVVVGPPLR
jgi:hypothetical protein